MNIHSPRPPSASPAVSSPFPPFLRSEPSSSSPSSPSSPPNSATSASSAVHFSPPSSVFLRVLCGGSRTLATFATFAPIGLPFLPRALPFLATFAAHWQCQTRQIRLNSRSGRRARQIHIKKRQKRQCSLRRSTLPSATAAPRRLSPLHSPLGVARSSTGCRNVTVQAPHHAQIRPRDLPVPPDARARATPPGAKPHGAWAMLTVSKHSICGSRADQPQSVSVRCSPNGHCPGYSFLILLAGYHLACAARLACAISNVLMSLLCHCKSWCGCYSPVACASAAGSYG
jgi:hypothetical protein